MFDTHCHLNFSVFDVNVSEVIQEAKENGVTTMLVPGTNIESSKKAVEIALETEGVYAAVGIHPHHVFELGDYTGRDPSLVNPPASAPVQWPVRAVGIPPLETPVQGNELIKNLERLFKNEKVVAVGEVGIDRHEYRKTKYENYKIDESFIKQQKDLLEKQILLALAYDKGLILHNREAKKDTLSMLNKLWDKKLEERVVFHCCEPDGELLKFAKSHKIFIGVDGDVTYSVEKQEFIKLVPIEMLVLETDSPFLVPEPLRSRKVFPNEPKNIKLIVEFIAKLLKTSSKKITEVTTANSNKLFRIER